MLDGPLPRYRQLVREDVLRPDPAQRAAIEKLQLLHARLKTYEPSSRRSIWGLFGFTGRGEEQIEDRIGLYIYGGVGRGKSMLMDLFFERAPVEAKRRVHFHAFMQEVHRRLDAERRRDAPDPIPRVATAIASETTLLCFDEMQVSDIADAMILGRLFESLFARGVIVVTTSNRHPSELYKDGLQRALFLPFIDMLCARLDVHHLDGVTDFRVARPRGLETYFTPLGDAAQAAMDKAWREAIGDDEEGPLTIRVQGRDVVLPRASARAARATFRELCEAPLGAADFLAIADRIDTLFLDGTPTLSRLQHNPAKRFVTLIDTLYEGRRQLVMSAAAEPNALYVDGAGAFEFERTASRLEEMRSADWPPHD